MKTTEWLDQLGDFTTREVARKSGISERTLQHQVTTGRISMENVVTIAAAYSIHPLRALIDTEFVDPAWAQVPDIDAALRLATEQQLDEILRRLNSAKSHGEPEPAEFTTPVDDLASRRQRQDVSDMPDRFAASDRGPDAKIPDSHDLGEESQDPGHDDPA